MYINRRLGYPLGGLHHKQVRFGEQMTYYTLQITECSRRRARSPTEGSALYCLVVSVAGH